tara:strand:- start:3163 stop:3297 length:135 start_codon:yes stop_codon:yes gene_type:complete
MTGVMNGTTASISSVPGLDGCDLLLAVIPAKEPGIYELSEEIWR